MTTSDPVIRAETLEQTYDGGRDADPWDAVQDYGAATRYASKHPDKGSYALSGNCSWSTRNERWYGKLSVNGWKWNL